MNMLHVELREARVKAGLSQQALATLSGIPRNQVVRAERGENITLDTLRKLAVHLPLTELSLIDTTGLRVDTIADPDKLFVAAVENVVRLTECLKVAIQLALDTRAAAELARRTGPMADNAEPPVESDPFYMLRGLQRVIGEIQELEKGGPPPS